MRDDMREERSVTFRLLMSLAGLIVLLAVGACRESPITEVGNPKTNPTAIEVSSALASSITRSIAGSLFSLEGRQETSEESDAYTCDFDEQANSILCTCTAGGTITKVFGQEVLSDGEIRFSHTVRETYDRCRITSCDVRLELTGSIEATYLGVAEPTTGSDDLSIRQHTQDADSGMVAGEVPFGFDTILSLQGGSAELSGTICIGTCLIFASLAEFQSQVDPNNQCPEGFSLEGLGPFFGGEGGPDDGDGFSDGGVSEACHDCFEACFDEDPSADGFVCEGSCEAQGVCEPFED